MNKTFLYRKDLLKMGLQNNAITQIVSKSKYFSKIEKYPGYALRYSCKQAFFVCVGCAMLLIGLPLKKTDIVFEYLRKINLDFNYTIARFKEREQILTIRRWTDKKEEIGIHILDSNPQKNSIIDRTIFESVKNCDTIVTINLCRIIEKLDKAFKAD